MKTQPDKWGTPIKRDLSGVEHLRQLRGVKTFADFPQSTQDIYLQVAKCFPGWQVWAVGSRVRGDYIDVPEIQENGKHKRGDWLEYSNVIRAREAAGMKDKVNSDYDFLVSPEAVQTGELPPDTERVKCRIPETEKIEIPIFQNGMELG